MEYVDILADGSLRGSEQDKWFIAKPLPQKLNFPAGGPYPPLPGGPTSSKIYVIGGENPDRCPEAIQKIVYVATPEPDGSIQQWQLATSMPAPSFDHAATFCQNSIIVTGGSLRRPSG